MIRRCGAASLLLALLAGCGGGNVAQREVAKPKRPACRDLAHARGYRVCSGPTPSKIERADGTLVSGPVERIGGRPAGWWRTVVLSRDGKTLLAQWSGLCEIQHTFFVSARGGKPRVVTRERHWPQAPMSEALGWRGSRALVRLPLKGEPRARRPGVYLIDPHTFERTLVRSLAGFPGC